MVYDDSFYISIVVVLHLILETGFSKIQKK